jgi:hypothetical protein
MRVKFRLATTGASKVVDVPADATPASLRSLAVATFALDAVRTALFIGFPPVALTDASLIRDGSLVEVRVAEPPPQMTRRVVAADNSCLFTSVIYALSLASSPSALRADAAAAVLADPEKWSEGVLGKPPAEYVALIKQPTTWGGAIELAIFSQKFKVEFAAIEIRSGTVYTFGENDGFEQRAYLVFDGLHYDPLERGSARLFSTSDADALGAAQAFAADMRAKHEYTDTLNFTLRCLACAQGLVGEADAQKHAKETGVRRVTRLLSHLTRTQN